MKIESDIMVACAVIETKVRSGQRKMGMNGLSLAVTEMIWKSVGSQRTSLSASSNIYNIWQFGNSNI
jgi:hypothetical protein